MVRTWPARLAPRAAAFTITGIPIKAGSSCGDPNRQNSLLQDLNQISQNLASSILAEAQQAYSTLQQQTQQFALGGASLSSLSPVSFDA